MKAVLTLFFLIITVFFNLNPVFSQTTALGFTLSPPFKEIILEKEASQSSYFIEIANNTAINQTLYLSVVNFGSLDESGGVAFLGARPEMLERKYSLAPWVSLEKDVVELESKKSQKIKVTVVNKESLFPGGHYAAVVVTLNSQKEEGRHVSFNAAFASLIFVKKTGGEIYRLDLVGKEVRSRVLGFPNNIALRFQNSGNVHLSPRGIITLEGPRGTVMSRGIINPESGIILPESFRIYHTTLDRLALPLLPGFYVFNIQYRHEGKEGFTRDSFAFFYPGIAGLTTLVIFLLIIFLILLRIRLIKHEKS